MTPTTHRGYTAAQIDDMAIRLQAVDLDADYEPDPEWWHEQSAAYQERWRTAARDAIAAGFRPPAPAGAAPTVTADLVRRGILAARWPDGARLDGITNITADMLTASVLALLAENGIEVQR